MIRSLRPLLRALALTLALAAVAAPAPAASAAPQQPAAPAQGAALAPAAEGAALGPLDVVRLMAHAKGKVTILNFWASWCAPCRAEIPELNAVRRAFGEDKLVLLGLSVDEDPGAYARFVATTEFAYPVHLVDDGVAAMYRVGAIPRIVVYDTKGKLAVSHEGGMPAQTLTNLVTTLLTEN